MIAFIVSVLLFYFWSFLPKRSIWHAATRWSILTATTLGAFMLFRTTVGFVPAAFLISKTWIIIGIIGLMLIRARDNRFVQLLILLGVVQYLFFMRDSADKPTTATSTTPELLIAVAPSQVVYLSDRYDVDIDLLVEDSDLADQVDLPTIYSVDVADGIDVRALVTLLSHEQGVRWVEINDEEQLQFRPGGTIVDDPLVQQQWAYDYLQMDEYHQTLQSLTPERPAKLYILDSGIQANHEDLADGYSRLRGQSPRDANGHGTHCAGIAAAATNNGKGVASFSPGNDWVELRSLAVINAFGLAPQSAVVKGIINAADQGADVISMSLGGRSTDTIQYAYNTAVRYARDKGAIVISAAGNSSMPASQFSPANSQGIIAVSAVGMAGVMAPFSNSVSDVEMGIAAPGVDILSTFKNGKYKANSGTSMAAPMVAGLAAVCKALNPDLATEDFYQAMVSTGAQSSDTQQSGAVIMPDGVVQVIGGL